MIAFTDGAVAPYETSLSYRKVYEQHPPLADCSNATFVPGGFEVFTPGDWNRTRSALRYPGRFEMRSRAPGLKRGVSTHPIIVKDAVADLHEDVPRRLLKREFHALS